MSVIYHKRISLFNLIFGLVAALLTVVLFLKIKSEQHGFSLGNNSPRIDAINKKSANTLPYPSTCGSVTTKKVCASSLKLDAEANQSNYTWSTGETTPSITVTTSGLYWWETVNLDNNIAVNGDFSAGNSGFTSNYTYIAPNGSTGPAGALQSEAYYTITTNPRNAHTGFSSFPDHTGNGNMMVVNGAPTAGVTIWRQTINVNPNTDYVFSVWFTSVNSANPGVLQFSINNEDQGTPIMLSSDLPGWKNFLVRWNSGNRNKAIISIENQNTAAFGNDFALDDIVFAPVCRNYFDVTLSSNPAKPTITPQ
jgi:hypothetical protein